MLKKYKTNNHEIQYACFLLRSCYIYICIYNIVIITFFISRLLKAISPNQFCYFLYYFLNSNYIFKSEIIFFYFSSTHFIYLFLLIKLLCFCRIYIFLLRFIGNGIAFIMLFAVFSLLHKINPKFGIQSVNEIQTDLRMNEKQLEEVNGLFVSEGARSKGKASFYILILIFIRYFLL